MSLLDKTKSFINNYSSEVVYDGVHYRVPVSFLKEGMLWLSMIRQGKQKIKSGTPLTSAQISRLKQDYIYVDSPQKVIAKNYKHLEKKLSNLIKSEKIRTIIPLEKEKNINKNIIYIYKNINRGVGKYDVKKISEILIDTIQEGYKKGETNLGLQTYTNPEDYYNVQALNMAKLVGYYGCSENWDREKLSNVMQSAILSNIVLHNMDKIFEDSKSKYRILSKEKIKMTKKHGDLAGNLLKTKGFDDFIVECVRLHHNKDAALRGNTFIDESANLIGLFDVYSALTMQRLYRRSRTFYESMLYIIDRAEKRYKEKLVKKVFYLLSQYCAGTRVLLRRTTDNEKYIGVVLNNGCYDTKFKVLMFDIDVLSDDNIISDLRYDTRYEVEALVL